jgi:hypothetical protein
VVVISATVLVLHDQLEALAALRDDVDASAASRRNLRLADAGEVDADLLAKGIELLG